MDLRIKIINMFTKSTRKGYLVWHKKNKPLGVQFYKAYLSEIGEERIRGNMIEEIIKKCVDVLAISYEVFDSRLVMTAIDDNDKIIFIDDGEEYIKKLLWEFYQAAEESFLAFHKDKIFCDKCDLEISKSIFE